MAVRQRQFAGQRGLLRVIEKLHDGRFPFAAFDLDERETLRAKTLRVLGHRFDLTLRRAGESLGVERLHDAAGGDRAPEYIEAAGAKLFRKIGQLHPEARGRFVAAVAIERLLKREALERRGGVHPQRCLPDPLQESLDQMIDVLALDERHLDVDLREFQLAIGPQSLLAITPGELKIALPARD